MANLKDLKNRIKSVKSTQKITSAMKMVAAAKLRRAQENAEASRPYSTRMSAIINSLASKASPETAPALLAGTGQDNRVLLIVVSADRGLCGGFNGSIIRATRRQVEMLKTDGKTVDLLMVGRKAKDALQREFADIIVDTKEGVQGTSVSFADIDTISDAIIDRLENGQLDRCQIIFNRFVSAISQEVNVDTLIPVTIDEEAEAGAENEGKAPYEYEPDEASVLADLLPRNLSTQIYAAILESSASELAARMTAMDNATRNAGDLIDRLTMVYNRTRQAAITTELIEIISGAEAL
ncbi:MAG TPA: F0F1 ATP synthase subunit gamma [Alphaproteobacteria bacterium]|nr:F0F1 ATP synthase subunit gamma [Alphaproteobacteria bacterium]|tara:strand:+ start:292 stop:1176 length:885 start_codon:yes stop_codon:yes gene_type:complete